MENDYFSTIIILIIKHSEDVKKVFYVCLYANNVLIIIIQEVFELTVKSILLYLCMICNSMCILDVFWGYYKQCKCIWYSLRIFAVKYLCINFLMYDCKKENGKEFFHSLNWALKIKFALNCNKIQTKLWNLYFVNPEWVTLKRIEKRPK